MAKLTDIATLSAIVRSVGPQSAYIASELRREWGERAHEITAAKVLRSLRRLQASGLVDRVSSFPEGYYGFRWRITESGRAALKETL